jgi:hypothetical protein
MFFIRDCNDAIVGNPKGYPTFKGANIQANKPNAPAYRAIWTAYDMREMMYEQTCMPVPLRARGIHSIRFNEEI